MAEPLRIGLVCPYSLARPGGVQNHVLGLGGHLLARGHEVQVLAPGRPAPGQLATHGLIPDHFTTTGGAVPVPANGSTARVSAGPATAHRVRRWVRAHPFDVLHVHEPVTPSASLLALSAVPDATAAVATFHSIAASPRLRGLARRATGPLIDRLDVTLAVSATAADEVRGPYRVAPDIIPNGFAHDEFSGAPRRGPGVRVTFLGRVDELRKGLDVFLEAGPLITAARPDARLVVAGPGRRVLPVPFIRTGPISDRDRAVLLRTSDVVVAPNTGHESFGLVVVEALAAGARVVASDLEAFRAVVTDRDGCTHARLVPPGDPAALAAAVVDELSTGAAAPAASAYVRTFDWMQVGERIEGAYAQARARRAAAVTSEARLGTR